MQLDNSFIVPVPVAEAWPLLLDIERIAPCMPGAVLDSIDGDCFSGKVKVKLGAIQVSYQGTGALVDKDQVASTITLAAKGSEVRGSGTASATVSATLSDENGATRVRVRTDLAIGGKAAQFGRGIMTDVADRIIGQFSDRLCELITASQPGGTAGAGSRSTQQAGEDVANTEPIDLGSAVLPALARRALPAATAVLVVTIAVVLLRRARQS